MKFPNISVRNFLGIGEADFALDDRGLVLVQGVNLDDPSADSNGSGKSSIIDAIFWCFYGETARGLTGDAVVNYVTGKNCVVVTHIIDGASTAKITRWRKAKGFHKPSGVSIEIDGTDVTGGTDALTQEIIVNFLGSSRSVFAASVYAGQEAMPDIPSMTDRQLKSLIEEAAGIDTIEKAYEIARQRLGEAKLDETSKRSAFDRATHSVTEIEADVVRNQTRVNDWKTSHTQRIADQKQAVLKKVAEAKALSAEIEALDLAGVQAEIDKIASDEIKVRNLITACDAKIEAVSDENVKRAALQAEVSSATHALNTAKRDLKFAIDTYRQLTTQAENIETKVGKPCGECGKPVTTEDLGDALKAVEAKIEPVRDQARKLKKQVTSLEGALLTKQAALDIFVTGMTDTSSEIATKRAHQTELAKLTETSRKLAHELASVGGMRARLDALKDAARSLSARMKEIEGETNPYVEILDENMVTLANIAKALKDREAEYYAASARTTLAAATAEVFGPKGVRAHILDTVTPFLNDRTAHYLSSLSDGSLEAVWSTLTESKAGELKEKFSIGVSKLGNGEFAGLSGGQKRKVRLATMLALQDLVASRASKPIELWIGDEIDVALDSAGLERLMSLLEMKAREKGTVLIVSHQDLADWCRDIAVVTMKDEIATMEGPICLTV